MFSASLGNYPTVFFRTKPQTNGKPIQFGHIVQNKNGSEPVGRTLVRESHSHGIFIDERHGQNFFSEFVCSRESLAMANLEAIEVLENGNILFSKHIGPFITALPIHMDTLGHALNHKGSPACLLEVSLGNVYGHMRPLEEEDYQEPVLTEEDEYKVPAKKKKSRWVGSAQLYRNSVLQDLSVGIHDFSWKQWEDQPKEEFGENGAPLMNVYGDYQEKAFEHPPVSQVQRNFPIENFDNKSYALSFKKSKEESKDEFDEEWPRIFEKDAKREFKEDVGNLRSAKNPPKQEFKGEFDQSWRKNFP